MGKPAASSGISPLSWLLPLLGLLLGAGAAWATAPRYHAPAAADEARLRQRAVDYYKASKIYDYDAISVLFTPAYQLDRKERLMKDAVNYRGRFATFSAETRADLQHQSESIAADKLELKVEGDWALTSGKFNMLVQGQDTPFPLQEVVWVRSSGEWWIYKMEPAEILRYGLPPEEMRLSLMSPKEREEFENLPQTMKDVPKEGAERYKPENAIGPDEAQKIREEQKGQGGAATPPGGK